MSTLIAANSNITSTLTVGNTTINQSAISIGNNTINSYSVSSGVVNTNVLAVDQIQPKGANATIIVPSAYSIYSPGSIVQVINTYLTNPFSLSVPASYNTYTDITGLTATITPKSSNSKIYMTVRWFGEINPQTAVYDHMWNIKRNGTLLGQPPANGQNTLGIHMAAISYYANDNDSTPETLFFDYFDAPGTVASLTYQICVASASASTLYTNRCVNGATTTGYERGTTSITLFEIAQ